MTAGMLESRFLRRLLTIVAAALIAAAALRLLAGPSLFRLYGPAATVLLALPFLHRAVADRLAEHGRSRLKALLLTLPLGLLAAAHILFWAAFFGGSANLAIQLGVVRHFIGQAAGRYLPWLALAAGVAYLAWLWRLAREPSGKEPGGG
jgi:hypothetical protein